MPRNKLIKLLCEAIYNLPDHEPQRIAIDGPGASGKTTLSKELHDVLQNSDRPIVCLTIDSFHQSSEIRYQLGPYEPKGYYLHSYDLDTIRDHVLLSMRNHKKLNYCPGKYNFRNEEDLDHSQKEIEKNAIVLFDGIFLFREELNQHWDYRIHLEVDLERTMERALIRDLHYFGSEEEVKNKYLKRYIPGYKIYQDSIKPHQHADIVIDNNDPFKPIWF